MVRRVLSLWAWGEQWLSGEADMTDRTQAAGTKANRWRPLIFSIVAAIPITAYCAYPLLTGDYNNWGMLLATFICIPASALFGLATFVSSIIAVRKNHGAASYVAAGISLVTVAFCVRLLFRLHFFGLH
jgi:hypothetical protein